MTENTSEDERSEQSGHSMGLLYGLAGSVVFFVSSPLFSGLIFPSSDSFGASVVAFACLSVAIGLTFGLAGLRWRPLRMTQSVIAASMALAFPILGALVFVLTGANSLFVVTALLFTIVALSLISVVSHYIPRLHRWLSQEGDGILSMELRHVLVPAVTVLLLLAVITSANHVVAQSDQCNALTPQVSWEFTTTNGSTEIAHDGGDRVQAERVLVALDQSSIAWSRLDSNDDDTVTAGDRVTAPYSESGETLELIYRGGSGDCDTKLGEHEIP